MSETSKNLHKQTAFKVTKHGVTVRYYHTPKGSVESWTVAWNTPAGRKRERRPNEDGARKFATEKAEEIAKGFSRTITAEERASFDRAMELLKPLGIPIESAIADYVTSKKILGDTTHLEAARYYVSKHASFTLAPVKQVVSEFLTQKRQDKLSDDYTQDLNTRLNRFAEDFLMPISNVTGSMLDDWLRSLTVKGKQEKLEPGGRNNYRAAVITLFNWAKQRRYLPKDFEETDSIVMVKEGHTDIEIYTPKEMQDMLLKFDWRFTAFLAIGAFAGLRSSEIQRLKWTDINIDRGFIRADQRKGNTPSKRLVPILPNLKSWLQSIPLKTGKVCHFAQTVNRVVEYARKAEGVTWKKNALRHSFISYRVADTQNVPQVALESGNSPKKIFSNYRELVTAEQAKEWFNILPDCHTSDTP